MNLLVELGVSRLSIGVQTFNLGLRKMLGRRGGGKEVVKKLNRARKVFPLLTIGILYDLPEQGKRDVIADLQTAVGIGIDGISLYPLIYSPKTLISRQFEQPPIETAMDIFRNAVDIGEMITGKNVIKLTSEGIFCANTIAAEMAVEYLYEGRRELLKLQSELCTISVQ